MPVVVLVAGVERHRRARSTATARRARRARSRCAGGTSRPASGRGRRGPRSRTGAARSGGRARSARSAGRACAAPRACRGAPGPSDGRPRRSWRRSRRSAGTPRNMSCSTEKTIEVADEHAHPGAQQRIAAAAVAAGADVAPALARGRDELEADLPEDEHERARDVRAVGQEGSVPRVGPLLVGQAAGREQRACRPRRRAGCRGSCRRRRAGRCRWSGTLDRRAVVGVRAGHELAATPCRPSERRGCRRCCRAGSRPGWRPSATRGRSPSR